MDEEITLLRAVGRGKMTVVCETAEQIYLAQISFSDEVKFTIYSHLSFGLAQNKPKNMKVLRKARLVYRGADGFCVKESLRCGEAGLILFTGHEGP
jgi:hypothetical protein